MLSISQPILYQFQSSTHSVKGNVFIPSKKVIIPNIKIESEPITLIKAEAKSKRPNTKSALKSPVRPSHQRSKSVTFKEELTKVRTFDKLLCPQAISGKIPLSISCPELLHLQHRIFSQNVCLETITLDSLCSSILGKIRVNNLDYAKKVTIRYTFDNWNNQSEIDANYFRSLDQTAVEQDLFKYKIDIPNSILSCNSNKNIYKLEFAVQYQVKGESYWDNNQNKNYIVDIHPSYFVDVKESDKVVSNVLSFRNNRMRSKSYDNTHSAPSLSNLIQNTTTNSPFSTRYSFDQSLKSTRVNKVDIKSLCKEVEVVESEKIRSQSNYESLSCSPVNYQQPFGWAMSSCY